MCYDLYYLDQDWRLLPQLDPSSGPFCPFLRCKGNTSKIYQNHCKNYGFGNMSLLEGTQIGSKMALCLTRKIIQKQCKTQGFWPSPPLFFKMFFSCFVFSMKNVFFHNWVFYLNRSSIFRDLGFVFSVFLVCFSGVFFEASFGAIQ